MMSRSRLGLELGADKTLFEFGNVGNVGDGFGFSVFLVHFHVQFSVFTTLLPSSNRIHSVMSFFS